MHGADYKVVYVSLYVDVKLNIKININIMSSPLLSIYRETKGDPPI